MTPSSRVQSTIQIIEKIMTSRVPMDSVCGDFFRTRRYIGSKDRAAIVEMVYGIMRHMARLSFILDTQKCEKTPRFFALAYLLLTQEPLNRIRDLFDGSKYGPDKLDEDEAAFIDNYKIPDFPEAIEVECPPEHENELRAIFGDNFAAEMKAMLEPATLDLRVNLANSNLEKVMKFLEADNVITHPTPYSPWGLRCESKAFLSRTKAMAKGWIEIQDEGSQLIALACDAKPGMQVLDYCAGAGGKTLALAGSMQNKGRIVAMDIEARRLEKSRPRFRKAGVADIIEVRPISDEKNRKWLRRQKETFDIVLCDVPCSGTGTWRRNPDMRWRTYGPSLEELTVIQGEILEKVAHTLKPGGKLVYATCSLLRAENENQIEKFLEKYPEFKLRELKDMWPRSDAIPCTGSVMRLSPHQHQTDGFFAAVLQKTA